MNELELKFRLGGTSTQHWQQLFKARGARRLRLRARYFDTEDGRLAAARIALRLRLEGRRWVQTLKAAGDGPVHRLEHEVVVRAAAGELPALDLARHDGTPALERLRGALADTPASALVERHATDVRRAIVVLEGDDGSRVEAALDTGEVSAGERHAPICELELEHLDGPLASLFLRAQEALESCPAPGATMWLSTISKAEQGEQLRLGQPSPEVKAKPLRLPGDATGQTLLRAVLVNALEHMLPNLSQVAEGAPEAEHVHQARVGLRRMRTALRELQALSPAIDPDWEPVLSHTFGQLGARRDHEAVAQAVRPLLEAAGAPKTVWTLPADVDTTAAVRSPAFQRVLLQLLALAHAEADAFTELSHDALRAQLAQGLRHLHRQVLRDGRRFEALPIAAQHRVRKRVKRLRYLAEFAAPLWASKEAERKEVERFVDALKPVQESLGWHADCAVAAEHFAEDARHDPTALFAAGYLKAHLQTTARAARKALQKLRRARPFWKS